MQHHLMDVLFKDGVYGTIQGKWARLSPSHKIRYLATVWKAGQTLHEIGRAYGKTASHHWAARCCWLRGVGIPPIALVVARS